MDQVGRRTGRPTSNQRTGDNNKQSVREVGESNGCTALTLLYTTGNSRDERRTARTITRRSLSDHVTLVLVVGHGMKMKKEERRTMQSESPSHRE